MLVRRSFSRGTTTFADPLAAIASSGGDALFLPLEPEEVELVAPQVTFHGLDTLGIQLLGTGGWTTDEVMGSVSERHLNGVVAVTSRPPGEITRRYEAFVHAFEEFHRKTLRTPVAALGYDAALLLLRAMETGASSPEAVIRALEGIRDFPGATGILSIEEGRIVRRHFPVLIERGALLPLTLP